MHPLTRRLIHATPRPLRRPVELVLRTIEDTFKDRVPGLAAEIAFFTLLSLPPLLLAILGSVGFVGKRLQDTPFQIESVERLLTIARTVLTSDAIEALNLRAVFTTLLEDGNSGVASVGFLVTIYAASRAIRVVLVAVSIAYDLEDHRPGWKQRLYGVGITFAGILLGIVVVPVLAAGPRFGEVIDGWLGSTGVVAPAFAFLYWPGAVIVAVLLIATLYHVGAPWWTRWSKDLPGAILAVLLWIAGSAGLRVYADYTFTGEEALYASLAGPLVVLLWVYVSAFAVLLGAELNAELVKMSAGVEELPARHGDLPEDHDEHDERSDDQPSADVLG